MTAGTAPCMQTSTIQIDGEKQRAFSLPEEPRLQQPRLFLEKKKHGLPNLTEKRKNIHAGNVQFPSLSRTRGKTKKSLADRRCTRIKQQHTKKSKTRPKFVLARTTSASSPFSPPSTDYFRRWVTAGFCDAVCSPLVMEPST